MIKNVYRRGQFHILEAPEVSSKVTGHPFGFTVPLKKNEIHFLKSQQRMNMVCTGYVTFLNIR